MANLIRDLTVPPTALPTKNPTANLTTKLTILILLSFITPQHLNKTISNFRRFTLSWRAQLESPWQFYSSQ
jgi:hypothetical protein